jgi:hypothetical protein
MCGLRDNDALYIVYVLLHSRFTLVFFILTVALPLLKVGLPYDLAECTSHFALSPTPRCLAHKAVYPSACSVCIFMISQLSSGVC